MVKREGLVICLVMIVLMLGLVSAPGDSFAPEDGPKDVEMNECAANCKSICEDEECRSPCIQKCKVEFGFDDEFGEREKFERDKFRDRDDFGGDFKDGEFGKGGEFGDEGEFDGDGSKEEKIFEGYEDETLEVDAGTTPESVFYFVDKFFDRFGDDLEVREERISEIKAMIEAGDFESAKKALKDYQKLTKKLEKEIDPSRREEALRSAAAIRNAMRDIQDKIPPGERDEFVHEIRKREHSIATAAEIASKINELCKQLSELDPNSYYRTCRTGDDSPDWQKKLDKDLTKEQIKEARKFGKIMSECFKISGQNCRCEEIPFADFATACSKAAPLATACDIEGDETACEQLDNLDMPELPEHLQDVFDELESGMMESKYDMHMPKECREAGITNPRDCGKIMIGTNAPEECKQALLDSGCDGERECSKICDKIMMQKHAPECVEKGITDPEECRDFMFSIDRRPQECAEQGIHDLRDCKKFMDEGGRGMGGPGPGFDMDCRSIEDSNERLDCYDKASSQAKGFRGVDDSNYEGPCLTDRDWQEKKAECRNRFGQYAGDEPIMGSSGKGYECPVDIKCIDFGDYEKDYEEIKSRERECANKCNNEGKAWDFSGGNCRCSGGDYPDSGGEGYPGSGGGASCDDCANQCPGASGTGCGPNGCECYYEDDEPEPDTSPDSGVEPETNPEPEPEPTPEPEPEPESSGDEAPITGNTFLDYLYE